MLQVRIGVTGSNQFNLLSRNDDILSSQIDDYLI